MLNVSDSCNKVSHSALDEAALLRGLIAQDETAWREFHLRYARLIYSSILRVTAGFSAIIGPEDVREIYAVLCVQLLSNDKRRLRCFEPSRGNKLSTWIAMLAAHTSYDYLRRMRREPHRGSLSEALELSSPSPDPCDVSLWREQAELVMELLRSFSEKDREFVSLYYVEELEPEQIAERLSISVQTVYSKKHKIRSRLESLLGESQLAA
jgi:RNA polymerase sigma-70 factor (ECF subfamily)